MDETRVAPAPLEFAEVFSLLIDATTGKSPTLAGQSYTKRQKLPEGRGKLVPDQLNTRKIGTTYSNVLAAFQEAMHGRRMGLTKMGYIGLFPGPSMEGDWVHIASGCDVPYVMRHVEQNQWHFVGECYVHGIMHGEAGNTGFTWEEIAIV
jgi:hypothetical protein